MGVSGYRKTIGNKEEGIDVFRKAPTTDHNRKTARREPGCLYVLHFVEGFHIFIHFF